ncbi:MAG: penicillin acylase family protein [Chloroflexi bacterium]|nr:penicillin acylase family protein [Chloroflexota bacterium]
MGSFSARLGRWLAAPLAVGAAALGAGYYLAWKRPAQTPSGMQQVPGLQGTVEVRRDRWGVPHLSATNQADLFFAQGYVHAQDRLWQMELNRRVAAGRLSEIFGAGTLDIDRFMRRIGLRRAALDEATQLEQEEREVLEAYCAGVNAFLRGNRWRLPLECLLLRFRPEPWSPVDCLAWSKLMALSISLNWDSEVLRARFVAALGPERAAELEPLYPEGHPLAVPPGAVYRGLDIAVVEKLRQVQAYVGLSMGGSNAWVVAGDRSATGKPLLACDPHLAPEVPGIWYENHLVLPEWAVTGASLPGLPGVIMGHNGHIAWGITAGMVDVQDAYLERLDPERPHWYEYRGAWELGQVVREEIRVRGRAEPAVEEVLITRHGPIVTPVLRNEARPVALRSLVLDPSHPIAAGLLLNRARNWDEFCAALRRWSVPVVSFLYADTDGNTGYALGGRVPMRAKGHGLVPAPGWTGEFEWAGFVPFEGMPRAFNPDAGFALSANNRIVGPDFPYHIEGEWVDGFRAQRIANLLLSRERHSLADFAAMQQDVFTIPGKRIAEQLGNLRSEGATPELRQALDLLRAWDGYLHPDSTAGAIYEAFRLRLLRNLLAPRLNDLTEEYFGGEVHGLTYTATYLLRASSFLLRHLNQREPRWLEGTGCPTWEALLLKSLEEALEELRGQLGPEPDRWTWGRLHTVVLSHVLGRSRVLAPLFNLGTWPLGGDMDSILQTAFPHRLPYRVRSWMPSYRQIIDLADVRRSVAVHTTGQSGHPGSPHYGDLLPLWYQGRYHPLLWDRADVEAQTESVLLLTGSEGPAAPEPAEGPRTAAHAP